MSGNTAIPGIRPGMGAQPQKQPRNQFVMVKNYIGGLSVSTEPFDFSMPPRTFRFRYDVDKLYVPTKFALGVFVTPDALRMMEGGYFTFENLNDLIEMAEDQGYYVPDSIKNPKVTIKEIREILKTGDIKEMERKFLNASEKTKHDLVDAAKAMYNQLNTGVVGWIEDNYAVSLKPIEL